MKKVLMLATAALFITGVAFADKGKGKKKKCAKGQTCCKKDEKAATTKGSCCKDKAKTASM